MRKNWSTFAVMFLFTAPRFRRESVAPVSGKADPSPQLTFYWVSFGGDHNGDPYF